MTCWGSAFLGIYEQGSVVNPGLWAGIAFDTDQVLAISAVVAAIGAVVSTAIARQSGRQAIEVLEIPFLIPSPGAGDQFRLKFTDDNSSLTIPMRNVGLGPAILGDVQFVIDGRQVLAQAGGEIAIPAGDCQLLPLRLQSYKPDYEEAGELRIHYTHASGAKYLTRCQVKTDSAGVLPMGFRRLTSDDSERPFLFWPDSA